MTKDELEYHNDCMLNAMVECNKLTYGCLTTSQVANRLGMTARELYRVLKDRKILFCDSGMWMLEPEYVGLGLLVYRYAPYYTLAGEFKVRTYPVWTERGADFVMNELVN